MRYTSFQKNALSVPENSLHLFSGVCRPADWDQNPKMGGGGKTWKSVKGCVGFWDPYFQNEKESRITQQKMLGN